MFTRLPVIPRLFQGASFVTLTAALGNLRKRYLDRHGVRGRIAEALFISLLTSIVSFSLPLLVHCQVRHVAKPLAANLGSCRAGQKPARAGQK